MPNAQKKAVTEAGQQGTKYPDPLNAQKKPDCLTAIGLA